MTLVVHRWKLGAAFGLGMALAAWGLGACQAGEGAAFGDGKTLETTPPGGTGGSGGAANPVEDNLDFITENDLIGSGGACSSQPGEDYDKDGIKAGPNPGDDCNDCDPNVGPASIEVLTDPNDPMAMPADEDCDGEIDEVEAECDGALAINDLDPVHAANAIDICSQVSGDVGHGIVSAQWVRAQGAPATPSKQVGLLSQFGVMTPRLGGAMLAMSSGHARPMGHPEQCGSLTCSLTGMGQAPSGFPQGVPNCPGSQNINDDIGLELTLRAPKNAKGYQFDFDFYSFEFPEWVCTSYNDQFIALVTPPPMGSINGNITFDSMNNPVSVNIAFFDVCTYNGAYPQFPCSLGPGELSGTGFDVWNDAGATSWLVSQAPVTGGELVSIRFAIWDTGDSAWDSTVLIDNFRWIAEAGTISVQTIPVPK
jgi:hypothetical protein